MQAVTNIYCVYDSRVNQSFLLKTTCSYLDSNNLSHSVDAGGCTGNVYLKDTLWYQQINNDISLRQNNRFLWYELGRFSPPVKTAGQPCHTLTYMPQEERPTNTEDKWSFNETTKVITLDFSPGISRLDGESINLFRITSFSENILTIKKSDRIGDEYKFEKR